MENLLREMEVVLLKSRIRLEVDKIERKMLVCIDLPEGMSKEHAIEVLGAKQAPNREVLDLIYLDTWELVLDGQVCPTYSGKLRKVQQCVPAICVTEVSQQYPIATIDWSSSKGLTAGRLVKSKDWLKLVENANSGTSFERIAESSLVLYRPDILKWLFDHKGVKHIGRPTEGKPLPDETLDLLFNHYPRSLNVSILFELVKDPRCFSEPRVLSPLGWRLFEKSLENKWGKSIAHLVKADRFIEVEDSMCLGVDHPTVDQVIIRFKHFKPDEDIYKWEKVIKTVRIKITDDTLECEIVSDEIHQTYSIAIPQGS
jgi:hypothetical protein